MLDLANQEITSKVRADYEAMSAHAADCIRCNACTQRCPFGVDVVSRIKEAAAVFSK